MNREARAAVFENGPGLILDQGLPYDRCHVGVVTDFDGWQGLARHDIFDDQNMRRVMRTQIDVVQADGVGVLNADDARVADLAELCDGEVLLYGRESEAGLPEALASHRAEGGRTAVLHQGQVQLHAAGSEAARLDVASLLVRHGRAGDAALAEALLAAIATAWAFGISPDLIGAGLETFPLQAPA